MSDPFESPKSLIRHAREDLEEFKAICKSAVTGHDCYANVTDVDPHTGNKTFKIKFTGTIPSRARYTASNILNNLRHSLDQTLVASVEELTGRRSGELYFPIAANPNDLAGKLTSRIPPELHLVIQRFEPYPSGNGYVGGNNFLCAVTKTAGPNKHQITLSPCLDVSPHIGFAQMSADGVIDGIDLPLHWDIANNEAILGVTTPNGYISYDFQISFQIAFGDAGPLFRQPIIPVFHEFAGVAESIVLGLEAETLRLMRARS
jgi:hypothetical protein